MISKHTAFSEFQSFWGGLHSLIKGGRTECHKAICLIPSAGFGSVPITSSSLIIRWRSPATSSSVNMKPNLLYSTYNSTKMPINRGNQIHSEQEKLPKLEPFAQHTTISPGEWSSFCWSRHEQFSWIITELHRLWQNSCKIPSLQNNVLTRHVHLTVSPFFRVNVFVFEPTLPSPRLRTVPAKKGGSNASY